MQLLTHDEQAVVACLEAELGAIESRFAAELVSDLPCVNDLVSHIERYRGKMLRPRLVLMSGMTCGPEGVGVAHRVLATVVEMVHMATLVHDDILDEAQVRRRGRTINHLEGNEAAVMLGDYLISHAYHLCSSLDDPAVSRAIAQTTNTVCEGELLQLANRNNWSLDEGTYVEIIRRKTASLTGTCCRLAASLAGGTDGMAEALSVYGENVGIAFQIIDDVLDLVGDERTVGKTLGRDLEKGKPTLPLIRCLCAGDDRTRRRLLDVLARDGMGIEQARLRQVRHLVAASGALDQARAHAERLIEQAKASLEALPDSPVRSLLLSTADAVLTRRF